jgi:Kef-type K+ transport system membrane component KefB
MGLIAEAIGLHMIIGAFLAGLFIREEVLDEKVFAKIEDRIYGMSYSFFGPIFFASLAFHLDFSAFKTVPFYLIAVLVVAILGKILGSWMITAFYKMKTMESLAIGLALNNRGAVELIVASIGLQMGIIDQDIFSILIIMAFVTTILSIVAFQPVARRLKEG